MTVADSAAPAATAVNGGKRGKPPLSEGKKAERRLGLLLCAPAAIVMIAVTGWPIIYSIWLSLQRYDLRFPGQQEFVGFDNYAAVLTNSYWWTAFATTMGLTVVSVAIELVLGMALALVMHRTLVARGLVRTVSLIPYGIVTVVAAFSWYYAWTPKTGYLANLFVDSAPLTDWLSSLSIIVLAEVWKTTPFMALLLMAGLALVPDDLLKAASMDGAGPWQRFTKVMLPVMKPAILVALLFRTLDAFRIFDNIFVLTNGAQDTSSVSMQTYNNLIKGLNLGIGSTMAVLIFLTVAIIAFIFIKVFGTAAPGSDPGGKR
ncbi:carbohydrate ABC transporter permease [Amycolatopsis magusensis]|uniref:Multiple sugar transport system permease protein n=1 Tax=Amycolatopsis magusensis TaxID=882444 RepID=A0ABS4PN24_9PSEU|nr:sugar ABC transporter permease [Amycolatopsis magusensis]MBP2180814.1 multiple sugar transport system permease protein [Amycolatopsis magusensis]MDI5977463.1 sugar ABC transporter permease [Amycolatopsis magusensis]